VADTQRKRATKIPLGRGETVLVVEDEPGLLTLAKMMLEELGYRVLAAGTPGEAVELAEEHGKKIQLLITDVVMPEMNGRDLAERLRSLYPDMKILFMSGYTSDVIVHRGVLDEGVNFIQKPFSIKDLAVKVWKGVREK
jgi:two-component system sensor histidine kinase EvgS